MKNSSRRRFLQLIGAVTGSAFVQRSVSAWGNPAATIAVTPSLSLFEYAQVQLLDGPLRTQFDHNHDLFFHLDEDALLKPFRQREGMPAPGPDMGGWYDNGTDFNPADNFHSFIPGQLWTVSLGSCTSLCCHGIQAYAREDPSTRAWFRRNSQA